MKQLLVCSAVLGKSKDFGAVVNEETKKLSKPPEETPGVLFESVRGGPHQPERSGPGKDDARFAVVYDTAQVYPTHIVSYKT